MKVYVVQIEYCTGSWGDTDCHGIDSIQSSEEKASARIKELANNILSGDGVYDYGDYPGYPKIINNDPDKITVSRNGFPDENTVVFYEEYEVG